MPNFLFTPAPNTVASDFVASKSAMSREVFDGLVPELRGRAFTIKGVEDANIIQRARDRIAALPKGADWDAVKADVAKDLVPWLGEEGGQKRAELLLRVHGFSAYSAAQYQVLDRQKDVFPHWQYQTAEDDRVRDSHAALDQLVLPADSIFWKTHFPPWEFGCRCYVVPISQADADEIAGQDAKKVPEARRVLDPARLKMIEGQGTLLTAENGVPRQVDVRAPREKQGGSGFYHNPGDLQLTVDQLKGRYDEPTWAYFEGWAKKTNITGTKQTVWDWMHQKLPGAAVTKPAAAVALSVIAAERLAIRTAKYTSMRNLGGGVNETSILTNGRTVVFKPAAGESPSRLRPGIEPGTQYKREKAASIVDEVLGTGLVPPTEIIDWQGRAGSAQLFQQGFDTAAQLYREGSIGKNIFEQLTDRQRQDWQLLDELIGHTDRHAGNWMLRKAKKGWDIALIDNGLCLDDTGQTMLRARPASQWKIDATNRDRLEKFLATEDQWRPQLAELVDPLAINHMLARARALLKNGFYD